MIYHVVDLLSGYIQTALRRSASFLDMVENFGMTLRFWHASRKAECSSQAGGHLLH